MSWANHEEALAVKSSTTMTRLSLLLESLLSTTLQTVTRVLLETSESQDTVLRANFAE